VSDDGTLGGLFPPIDDDAPRRPSIFDEHRRHSSTSEAHRVARRRKRLRRRRRIIITVAVLVLIALPVGLIAGIAGIFVHSYSGNIQTIKGNPFPTVQPAASKTGAENILLLGSDSRIGLGDITDGSSTAQRSDTMLLVHIPADHKNVEVMSIMRDLWVNIPGHGEAKINAAFSYGGVPLAIQTVESLFAVRIDHVAVIDFQGFADMSTALGGVDVTSPADFTSKNMPGYSFVKGTNHVEGQAALAFVRERDAFASADYQRVRDQQSFLKGVLVKATSVDSVADVVALNSFVAATSQYLTVDKGLNFSTILKLGYDLRNVRVGDVYFFTLPTAGTGTSPDRQSIVLQDPAAEQGISAALKSDTFKAYLTANKLLNGN
jgi:LCP family protein required for cell wall assembly